MPSNRLAEVLDAPPNTRPAILEGQWLDSGPTATFAAINPVSVLEGSGDALAELPRWICWHADQFPAGAAVGYLSYELARFFETLPLRAGTSLPDLSFAYYPRVARFETLPRPETLPADMEFSTSPEVRSNFDERSYAEAVETIRDHIATGDIYQANLTCQFSARLAGISPERVYSRLSSLEPSFGAFLKGPQRTIISNSPERFFRVMGDRILASPIKGTIARSPDPALDSQCMSALQSSAKDLAENVMIVDLLRNDLGRICRYETIGTRMFEVRTLPHLFHLASHIEGTLQAGTGLVDILRALFPCGSITGAPKIQAMEILAEVEKVPRGVSMGTVGIIKGQPGTAGCEVDFNVAIRTMTIEEDVATLNVGGGIVFDSRAETEREEMMLKARPRLEALGASRAFEPRMLQACALER